MSTTDDIVYDAYLEIRNDGAALAQAAELHGCFATGHTPDDALTRLIHVIPAYYQWLRQHDDYTPDVRGPFRITVREACAVATLDTSSVPPTAGPGAFFSDDATPVSAEDLDWSLALLEWAYDDLATLQPSPPHAAIDQLLRAQWWLLSRLDLATADTAPASAAEPAARIRQSARATIARLRATSKDERALLHARDGEQWSLRKLLRRSILLVRAQPLTS